MSLYQLRKIYEHYKVSFSTSPEDLQKLKGRVLLSLKSSDSGFLVIDGKKWSRNELLELFESDLSDSGFDFDALQLKYSALQKIQNPESITVSLDKNVLTAISKYLTEVQDHFALHYKDHFYFALRNDLEKRDFMNASLKLSYVELFDPISKQELVERLQSPILQLIRFELGGKLKSVSFILKIDYYVFLGELGKHDPSFLRDQFNEMGPWIRRMNDSQRLDFFTFQKNLPYLEGDLVMVKDSEYLNRITNSQQRSTLNGIALFRLIMAIVILVTLVWGYNKSFSDNDAPPIDPEYQKELERAAFHKIIGVDEDDNQDSIRIKTERHYERVKNGEPIPPPPGLPH